MSDSVTERIERVRRSPMLITLSVFAAVAIAACGGSNGGAGEAKGPIKVGLSGALTGGDAILGQTQREGVQLAVDEINSGGGVKGRKIELVTEDEANDCLLYTSPSPRDRS